MLDMHFYSIYIYIEKKPLNWEWHSRLGNIQNKKKNKKNATTLEKKAIIEKAEKVVLF